MSDDRITYRNDYDVGLTLDTSLEPCPSPFSDESMKKFVAAFKEKSQNTPDSYGEFTMTKVLSQTQSSLSKALGVDGQLNFSYGPVTGDANVKFAMDNVQGSMSLTVVIKAKQEGRVIKNGLDERAVLELRPDIAESIKNGTLTLTDFKKKYGRRLVFGYEYGGVVSFIANYSTKSSEDKMSVAGGLSVAYKKVGVELSGSVHGDYKSEDVSKSTDYSKDYKIFPSYSSDLIDGADGIISLLEDISNPNTLEDDSKSGDVGKELSEKIHKLLSGTKLDVINCFVVKIDIISCVDKAFSNQKDEQSDIQSFVTFANPLYMTMKSILGGTEPESGGLVTMSLNYDKYDPDNKEAQDRIKKYMKELGHKIKVMTILKGDKLYEYAQKYENYTLNGPNDDEKSEQIDKEHFYEMDVNALQTEFEAEVLGPYNKMMKDHGIKAVDKGPPGGTVIINQTGIDLKPQKNQVIGTLAVTDGIYVSFDIKIASWAEDKFLSILQIGNGDMARLPAFYTGPANDANFGKIVHVSYSRDDNNNPWFNSEKIEANTMYNVELYATMDSIQASVNNQVIKSEKGLKGHPKPGNVNIYVGNPWYDAADCVVSNLFIKTYA